MDVLVTWTSQVVQHAPGSQEAHHFHIGLGVLEADEPLTSTSHLFPDVSPGSYEGHGEVVASDGTELQTPVTFNVTVPEQSPVNVPVIVNISGQSQ